jgi:hypothetical protein
MSAGTASRRCAICNQKKVPAAQAEGTRGVCAACCRRFGLTAGAHETRRPVEPCARCQHGELVRCLVRERLGDDRVAPLAAAFPRRLKVPVLMGDEMIEYANAPDVRRPTGVFVAYVCRRCGFTEWYALSPETIPVGVENGTELVVAGPARHPYR